MIAVFKKVNILYEEKTILESISFSLREGEFVYLIGKTGSGKSSILRTLYADLELQSGEAHVLNYDLKRIKSNKIAYLRRQIGIAFQDFELLTDRTVEENLLFVLKATGWNNSYKMNQRINEALELVDLRKTRDKMPFQLSGGEQQRIVIARALLNRPRLLIADEPTGNLDPHIAMEILRLFVTISQQGTTILMATHHHSFVKKFPARVFICGKGLFKDIPKLEVIQTIL